MLHKNFERLCSLLSGKENEDAILRELHSSS